MPEIYSERRGRIVYRNSKRTWRKHHFLFEDLQYVNLAGQDLQECVFECCRLTGANFAGANLQGASFLDCTASRATFMDANMQGSRIDSTMLTDERDELGLPGFSYCNFSNVHLGSAKLDRAVMTSCDMRDSYLYRAAFGTADILNRFSCANLAGVVWIPKAVAAAVPKLPDGKITGWKRCADGRIVELEIPKTAQRSAGLSRKIRASFAITRSILSPKFKYCQTARSQRDTRGNDCAYRVGYQTVADTWDPNPWSVCTHGIHFFLTRDEAVAYARG